MGKSDCQWLQAALPDIKVSVSLNVAVVRQRSRGAFVSDPCGPPHLQSRAVAWRPCPAAGLCYGSWTGPPPAVCAGPELSRVQCGGPGSSPSWRERNMFYCNKRKTRRQRACWGKIAADFLPVTLVLDLHQILVQPLLRPQGLIQPVVL